MQRTWKRLGSAVAVLGAALALQGCPPPYPKCENDAACKEHGEVCVQGQCQQCATDAQCPANFVCQATKCVPKPECVRDEQCGAGKKCQAGKCAVDPNAKPKDEGTANACDKCGPDQVCKDGACVRKGYDDLEDCHLSAVRFGFNDVVLTPEARQALDTAADCLKSIKGRVVLEGHADERGTEEYNLQLSNRRAAAVKKYLSTLGVGAAKLDTVGYGENKPAVDGHDEAAWAANRRVEFTGK